MKNLLIALNFLTILPFKIHTGIKSEDYAGSLIYFPVAGMIIGAVLSIVSLLYLFLPAAVVAVFVLIVSVFITGALHLDGFSDTCDAFYGQKPKEEILKIMRDPRCGAMGAIGVTLLLLLKFSLLISIPQRVLLRSLVVMCCFSRWSQTICCLMPYSRSEGKAEAFIKYARKKDIIIAGLFTILISFALLGFKGIGVFFVSIIPVLLFIRYSRIKIGGMTGDTIGAVNEIAEVSVLFSILIISLIWI
jgi:adenosylcobinamide-GDP ribazoletransferase